MNDLQILCDLLISRSLPEETQNNLQNKTLGDWEALLQLSRQHSVGAILLDRLSSSEERFLVPGAVKEELRQVYLTNAVRNTLFLHEAELIFKAFNKAGLPAVALKGLFLLDHVYVNIALRLMGDLDLMVKKADIPGAIAILEDLGYNHTTYFEFANQNIDIKHVPPMQKDGGFLLELHWTLLEENEPFSIDPAGLWARAVPAKISGVDALALSLEDLILHLSLHLTYQHHLQLGLRGLYDISLVIAQNQFQIDWAALVARAKEWGAERVLAITLTLLEDILAVPIPGEVIPSLTGEPIPAEILARAKHQLLFKAGDTFAVTPDLAKLSERSGLGNKLNLIASRIFLPKTTMARIFNVDPHSLKIYFYYPVRFYQLMRGYAKSAWQIAFKDQERVSAAENTQAVVALKHWFGHQE